MGNTYVMDSRESEERVKSDRVASSQFLMIVIVFAIAIIVLVAWHPWVARQVNGVQQSDVATSRP
jgi:predicted negative regulator of RcsB-dependent stress response